MNDANRDGESSLKRKTSNETEKQMKAKNLSCGGCDEFYFADSFGLFNGDVALSKSHGTIIPRYDIYCDIAKKEIIKTW